MSTFNGHRFLVRQIQSLQDQSHTNWRLIVRDDGSIDDTQRILSNLASQDRRIHIAPCSGQNLGAASSFISLLQYVTAPNFMFCDQDDLWYHEKIAAQLRRLAGNETVPTLTCSDLDLIESAGHLKGTMFLEQQNFSVVRGIQLRRLALQNVVVGCTVAGNAALLQLVRRIEGGFVQSAVMHDWWVALTASAFGQILYDPNPTVQYRIHSSNTLGAPDSRLSRYLRAIFTEQPLTKVSRYLRAVASQAEGFLACYPDILSESDTSTLHHVAALGPEPRLQALISCAATGIHMHGWARNCGVFLATAMTSIGRHLFFGVPLYPR